MRELITITFLLVCTAITVNAQHKQARKINAVDGIAVSQGIKVEFIQSDRNEVVVEVEKKEFLDLLLTDLKSGTLKIHYKPKTNISLKQPSRVTVYSNSILKKAKVNSGGQLTINPTIKTSTFSIDLSSSAQLFTSKIEADKIELDISLSAKLEATIYAKSLEIDASSSAKTILSGSVNNVEVDMSSSANLDLSKVSIDNLEVDGSSSAKLTINTAKTIKSDLSSSAKIFYSTEPTQIIKNNSSSGGKMMGQ